MGHRADPWGPRRQGLRRRATVYLAGALGGAPSCANDPAPWLCPPAAAGDLVITELRGPQAGPNSRPQFIELYHAGGDVFDLHGLRLVVTRLDGSDPVDLMVRTSQELQPGGYFAVGLSDLARDSRAVSYAPEPPFVGRLYRDAAVTLVSCDELLDRVVVRDLPDHGTWSLGLTPPDAEGNDDPSRWCVDARPAAGPHTALGLPGTPETPNPGCP